MPPFRVLVWTSGVLDNSGETLQLLDAESNEVDRVVYVGGPAAAISPCK